MLATKYTSIDEIPKEEVERVKEKKGKTKSLLSDVIFKAVFLNEPDILVKMIKDIFNINEDINNPLVISGYESVPDSLYGKTFKSDLLIKLSDNSYVLLEMNNKSKKGVLDRNLIQLFRVHGQILPKGIKYEEINKYEVRGLNLNYKVGKRKVEKINKDEERYVMDKFAFCDIVTGAVASNIITLCNLDIEKSYELVYNNIRKKDAPLSARWGAIFIENDVSKIISILGDALTMEQKERLSKKIEEVNESDRVLKDWIIEDNSRWCKEELEYNSYTDGFEEGTQSKAIEMIKNMLKEKYNYEAISKVSGKTVEEIKEIEKSMKEEK